MAICNVKFTIKDPGDSSLTAKVLSVYTRPSAAGEHSGASIYGDGWDEHQINTDASGSGTVTLVQGRVIDVRIPWMGQQWSNKTVPSTAATHFSYLVA